MKSTSMFRALRAVGCAVALVLVVACGSDGDAPEATESVRVLERASLVAGDAVPAPEGPVVLSVATVAGAPVQFDLATLERAGLVEAELYEPFEHERLTFSGVELRDVLELAGVASTTDVHLTALDDYAVDLTVDQIQAGGILIATQSGGEEIAIAEGGPIRVVFVDGTESGSDEDLWIWSLSRIDATT